MKILPAKILEFISSFGKSAKQRVGFLYGDDASLVQLYVMQIRASLKGMESIILQYDDFGDPDELLKVLNSEIYTDSFFGSGPKLIVVNRIKATGADGLIDLLSKIGDDRMVIVTCEESVDARNKFRVFCENFEGVACVACYADNAAGIKQVAGQFLQQNGLKCDRSALDEICLMFDGNRAGMLAELEKLITYKGSDANVTISDLHAILDEDSKGGIFDAVNAFFDLNLNAVEGFLQKVLDEKIPVTVLMSSISSYLMQLVQMRTKVELDGKSIQTVVTEERVFFKQIPITTRHLEKWHLWKLKSICKRIIDVEYRVRFYHQYDEGIFLNFASLCCLYYAK